MDYIVLTILFLFIVLVCYAYFCKSIFDTTSDFLGLLFISIAIIAVIFGILEQW